MRGRTLRGEARVVPGDSPEFREAIEATLRRIPWLGSQLGLSRRATAAPGEQQWRAIARGAAMVEIALAAASGGAPKKPSGSP